MTYGDSAARKRAPAPLRGCDQRLLSERPLPELPASGAQSSRATGAGGGGVDSWLPPVRLDLKDQGVGASPKPSTPTTPAVRRVPNPGVQGAAGVRGCRRSCRGNVETPRSWGLRWPEPRLPRVSAPARPPGQRGPAVQPPRRGWDIKAGLE